MEEEETPESLCPCDQVMSRGRFLLRHPISYHSESHLFSVWTRLEDRMRLSLTHQTASQWWPRSLYEDLRASQIQPRRNLWAHPNLSAVTLARYLQNDLVSPEAKRLLWRNPSLPLFLLEDPELADYLKPLRKPSRRQRRAGMEEKIPF